MKVALVLFDWFPHGGLQRDCLRIGRGLVRQQVGVDVLCMRWDGPAEPGFNIITAPEHSGSKVARRKAFAAFVSAQRKRAQYDAVTGFNRLPDLDFYFAADTCFAWKAARERSWLYRLAPRCRQYLAYEKAVFGPGADTRIFMLSPLQKQEYLACYPDSVGRIVDIPPGIDRNRMANDNAPNLRKQFRDEFAVGDDEQVIVQVGSGFRIKGVDRTLEAVASLPKNVREKLRLLIIGSDKAGKFQSQAESLGIAPCVTFTGGRDDLPQVLQGADLMLHPARKESAGMVILEAIVAGLPVLTTSTCGFAFHVEQANAGKILQGEFSQRALNATLLDMLISDRKEEWRRNGIAYGRSGDFYDMPERVATAILAAGAKQ